MDLVLLLSLQTTGCFVFFGSKITSKSIGYLLGKWLLDTFHFSKKITRNERHSHTFVGSGWNCPFSVSRFCSQYQSKLRAKISTRQLETIWIEMEKTVSFKVLLEDCDNFSVLLLSLPLWINESLWWFSFYVVLLCGKNEIQWILPYEWSFIICWITVGKSWSSTQHHVFSREKECVLIEIVLCELHTAVVKLAVNQKQCRWRKKLPFVGRKSYCMESMSVNKFLSLPYLSFKLRNKKAGSY